MCITAQGFWQMLVVASFSLASSSVCAQHVSMGGGAGIGTFLSGGAGAQYANWHRMGMLAVTLPHSDFQVRVLKGSLERTRAIESGTGDNDLDYEGLDFVATREGTGLPVALALGVARYEEAYHVGYPDRDLGGSEFVHRWGPHVSAMRSWPVTRWFDVWSEADLHYAPYQPAQLVLFLNVGIGVRF